MEQETNDNSSKSVAISKSNIIARVSVFLKGLAVGASMLIPGVSGGTMAMLLGIYDELIRSVNSIARLTFKRLPFLIVFVLGSGLGMLLFASPLKYLSDTFPMPTAFFFLGAVVGGVPLMFKKAQINSFSWRIIVYPLLGAGIIILISLLPANLFKPDLSSGFAGYAILFLVGIFLAVALVLPGISTSLMLLTLGIHQDTLEAISSLNLHFLLPLALGAIIGIFLTTGVLEKAMTRFPQGTYLIILGFVLGSVAELNPGKPTGGQLPFCILLFAVAFILLYALSKFEENPEKSSGSPPQST